MYLEYDEEVQDYICSVAPIMDEDDLSRIAYQAKNQCPYYRLGDEYTIVRKQN